MYLGLGFGLWKLILNWVALKLISQGMTMSCRFDFIVLFKYEVYLVKIKLGCN